MMELEVGGIYKIERKPMHAVKLFECRSDAGRHYYKHSMNAKILVIHKTKSIKRSGGQRYVAYFFRQSEIENFVECLYSVWIKKVYLIKKERDIDRWPYLARKHFLIAKGASAEAAMTGTIEEAQRQLTNIARTSRLQKEKKEKQKDTILDFKTMTGEKLYFSGGSTTAGVAPNYEHYKKEYKTNYWHETWQGAQDEVLPEPSDYDECCDEDPWEGEIEIIAQPPPLESVPKGLHPGYMKKPKKKRKKKKKQLPISQHVYTVGDSAKEPEPTMQTAAYKTAATVKKELEHMAYGKGIEPIVRDAAIAALKKMEEEEAEMCETVKAAKKELQDDWNWYKKHTKEETE